MPNQPKSQRSGASISHWELVILWSLIIGHWSF